MSDQDDSDNNNERRDLTSIIDMPEFDHSDDDDDFSDLEAAFGDAPPDLPADQDDSSGTADTDFASEDFSSEAATDPDIQIPDGFSNNDSDNNNTEETDFGALEDNDDADTDIAAEDEPEDNFASFDDDENKSESEFDSDFTANEEFSEQEDQTDDLSSGDDNFSSDENQNIESITEDFAETDNFASMDEDFEQESFEEDTGEDDFEQSDEAQLNTTTDTADVDDDIEFDSFDEPEAPPISDTEISEQIVEGQAQEVEATEEEVVATTSFGDSDKTSLPFTYKEEGPYQSPENFKDLQNFAKNISYGNMAKEGNPPFSIILKDVRFEEDVDDILRLLTEFKILNAEDRDDAKASLERGNMLIPRLGEFAAISLCHKLRRFDINILMGLTEEILPAKEYESDDRGLTTKQNIYNNKKHFWKFEKEDVQVNQVLVSTTPHIEGHDILEYISVITETTIINMDDFSGDHSLETDIKSVLDSEEHSSQEFQPASLKDIYSSLVDKCKAQAIHDKGNAIIGINYQIIPILVADTVQTNTRYQITCTGSVVWINKR